MNLGTASAQVRASPAPTSPSPGPSPKDAAHPPLPNGVPWREVPSLRSGTVTISFKEPEVDVTPGIFGLVGRFTASSEFRVSSSLNIDEPSDGSAFTYGLVQNAVSDHLSAVYGGRTITANTDALLLDISEGERAPFMHDVEDSHKFEVDNPTPLAVGNPYYVDQPKWPLPEHAGVSNGAPPLTSASASLEFRVGVVAREQTTGMLFQLGAVDSTYGIQWTATGINFATRGYTFRGGEWGAGTFSLTDPGDRLVLTPPLANTVSNKTWIDSLSAVYPL